MLPWRPLKYKVIDVVLELSGDSGPGEVCENAASQL